MQTATDANPDNDWLPRLEVSRMIRRSRRQVDRLIRTGELTGKKAGARVLVARWSVDAWIAGKPIR